MQHVRDAQALWFPRASTAEIRSEPVAACGPRDVTVEVTSSGISQGTETLIYRGEGPADQAVTPRTCVGESMGTFPIKYGYSSVGVVTEAGRDSGYSEGDIVFCRYPHQDRYTIDPDDEIMYKLPAYPDPEIAVFGNLLEVATNALLDVPVRLGEVVAVHGLGVVGLFCAQLAARSAGLVIGIDRIESRRLRAKEFGIHAVASPEEAHDLIMELTAGRGADISFEVSGAPPALQTALDSTAFEGTVVVISWYGEKVVPLVLSPSFHMKRLRMVSSQVNVVGGPLKPRWDPKRRMDLVWDLLPTLHPSEMITHRFPFAEAQSAFDIFSDRSADPLAVVLTYEGGR